MTSVVLLASPLLGPSVWAPVADELGARGLAVTVPRLPDRVDSPADVLEGFLERMPLGEPAVLVPHSNAGLYAPALAAARPVQAFRVGANVYATQFHPELDLEGICTRIEVYKNAGYFDPSAAETLKETSRAVEVRHPMRLLANFVDLHKN